MYRAYLCVSCFFFPPELRVIISMNSFNRMVCVMESHCVSCEVGPECMNIICISCKLWSKNSFCEADNLSIWYVHTNIAANMIRIDRSLWLSQYGDKFRAILREKWGSIPSRVGESPPAACALALFSNQFCQLGTGGCFSEDSVAGVWTWPLSSSAEVKSRPPLPNRLA